MAEDTDTARHEADMDRLCRALGTSRAYICDLMMSKIEGKSSLDPILLEEWLVRRGKLLEGESLKDCLGRHWGEDVAELAERLI